jgi:hypothetical protein
VPPITMENDPPPTKTKREYTHLKGVYSPEEIKKRNREKRREDTKRCREKKRRIAAEAAQAAEKKQHIAAEAAQAEMELVAPDDGTAVAVEAIAFVQDIGATACLQQMQSDFHNSLGELSVTDAEAGLKTTGLESEADLDSDVEVAVTGLQHLQNQFAFASPTALPGFLDKRLLAETEVKEKELAFKEKQLKLEEKWMENMAKQHTNKQHTDLLAAMTQQQSDLMTAMVKQQSDFLKAVMEMTKPK